MSAPYPRPARPPLVGRASEMRALRWALDELAAGRGAVLELTGDPGIGKTRLLLEFAAEAERRGFGVLKGNATEFERDLPFQVFVDALADRCRRSATGDAGDAARRLAAVFAGEEAPGSGAERFRVYRAVRDLLAGWARDGLLLLLDDMHWADQGAIELAEYLIRHPPDAPLLLALAHRGRQSHARLAGTLAHGAELGTVTRLEIGPLAPAESAELAGDELDEATRQVICAESGGNPLYLLAATAARKTGFPGAAAAGTATAAGAMPGRLEAVLLAELAPLTRQQAIVAAAGAVAGDQFGIDALPAIAGLSSAEVASAVGVLTRRDVLRPAESPAALEFRHPVLRRVVYQDCDPAWRAAAHRRALAELRRRGAAAAELAHHVAASPGADVPADIAILLAAANGAMSSAPAAAAQWLRVALGILPSGTAHDQQRLEILLLLTRALGVAGRLAESRDLLHEILRLVPLRPPGPRVAAVAFCATMERLLARYPEARALLEAELASPRAAATAESVPLAIEYGAVALLSGDFPAARQELAAAAARARRRGDRVREAWTLATSGFGEIYEGNAGVSAAAADAAAALADTLSDSELAAEPECLAILGWAELFLERFADADRHLRRGVSISRNSGQYHVLPHLLLGQCQLANWQGPLDRAIVLSEEAEEIARHIDSRDVLGLALGQRSFALAWSGGPDSAKRALDLAEQAVPIIPPGSVWWTRTAAIFHAVALLTSGDPARCVQVLTTAGGGAGLPLIQPSMRPTSLDMLTAAFVLAGDAGSARDSSMRADAESRRLGLPGQRGFALRSRGYVLSAAGRHEEAVAAYRDAAELLGGAGLAVGQAWALALGGHSAVESGQAGLAMTMADDAVSVARSVGSVRIAGVAEAVRQRLGTGGPARARGADPLASLTSREREIARLAATGRSSRDIAEQLSLSPRTVDTHLARVYRKLGLPSRSALAAWWPGPAG
ncbi:MAG: helix-turn-helix domain-containing protein [Streptosporangiaceae bacterium]|nr:helix-turn-helix domain-containing protein [Streptosporangiaceae bacterium]MBV9858230.1 helix-turn-helix domain-containing protein [Streptosporangiaceae bacterium]